MKQQMVERAFGSTFLEISTRNVSALEVALPLRDEQTAIATVLSDMDAELSALESRLWRPKFDRYITPELRQILLYDLAAIADWVEPDSAPEPLCRDPNDDKFLQLAQQAGCLCLITGYEDMLALSNSFPVPIHSPADALARLTP